jgi:hypothetical protein
MGLWTIEHVMHSSHEPKLLSSHDIASSRRCSVADTETVGDFRQLQFFIDTIAAGNPNGNPATPLRTSLAEISTIMLVELHDLHKRSGR